MKKWVTGVVARLLHHHSGIPTLAMLLSQCMGTPMCRATHLSNIPGYRTDLDYVSHSMYVTVYVCHCVWHGITGTNSLKLSSGVRCKVTILLGGKSGLYSLHVQVWRLLEVYVRMYIYTSHI